MCVSFADIWVLLIYPLNTVLHEAKVEGINLKGKNQASKVTNVNFLWVYQYKKEDIVKPYVLGERQTLRTLPS